MQRLSRIVNAAKSTAGILSNSAEKHKTSRSKSSNTTHKTKTSNTKNSGHKAKKSSGGCLASTLLGYWNGAKKQVKKVGEAISDFKKNHPNISNATDVYISKYRGTDVYVYYNANTGVGSYVDYWGNCVGGWKFSANQLDYHCKNGLKIF